MALYPGAPRAVTRSAVSRGPLPVYARPSTPAPLQFPTTVSGTGPRPPLFSSRPTFAPFQTTAFQGVNTPASSRPVSQTLSQVANQRVNAQLAPQEAAADAFNKRQSDVIQSFANALLGKLQPIAGQVGQQYDQAIQQTSDLSNQAANYLSAANPTGQVQQLLQSAGAPQSQQDQIAAQLGQTFGGGAGVLSFTGGVIPGQELAQDKVAQIGTPEHAGPLAQLPALAALKGQQDLASALWQQGQDRRTLEATRPGLYQAAAQDIRTNNAARQRAAATARQNAITNKMATAKYNEGVSEFNQTRSDKQAVATASAIAKSNTNAQANVRAWATFVTSPNFLKEQWDTPSLVALAKQGYGITLPSNFQAPTVTATASTKPAKITRDPVTGTYYRENPDGTLTPVYQGGTPTTSAATATYRTAKDGTILSIDPTTHAATPIYTPAPGAPKVDVGQSKVRGVWVDSSGQPIPSLAGVPPPAKTSSTGSTSPASANVAARDFAKTAAAAGSPKGTASSGSRWQYVSTGDTTIPAGQTGSAWIPNPNYQPGSKPSGATVPYWQMIQQGINLGLSPKRATSIVNATPGYDAEGVNGRPYTGGDAVRQAHIGVEHALQQGWTLKQALQAAAAGGLVDPKVFTPIFTKAYQQAAAKAKGAGPIGPVGSPPAGPTGPTG